ncbi:MAG: TerC family protein [Planctomycetes bacterium]|nr:TerC family protein [Planctomycetota bacterium]
MPDLHGVFLAALPLLGEGGPAGPTPPLFSVDSLISLITLSALEIVLGIDNIVFLSVLAARLPEHQRPKARRYGLLLAMVMRIGLLFSIAWLMRLTRPWFGLLGREFTGKDLILLVGGLFLIWKATAEIRHKVSGHADALLAKAPTATFAGVLAQILLIDLVFSLDSVITAVGMARHLPVMVAAVVFSVLIMLWAAGPIAGFVDRHPEIKILALSFLILIGVVLLADGLGEHIDKGYIYFAMAFALAVNMLQLRLQKISGKEAAR